MPLIEVVKPTRKEIPDPIIATKVSKEIQEAFDKLEVKKYRVTRAELWRDCVLDSLKRHEEAKVMRGRRVAKYCSESVKSKFYKF